jgi:HlyD family secretion protein
MKKKTLGTVLVILALGISAGVYGIFLHPFRNADKVSYETQPIRRGTIEETVSSTGNIQAKGSVEVLTQLTGTIERVYVDYNDRVKKGQVLAELEKDKLLLELRDKESSLQKTKAQYEQAQFTYEKNLELKKKNLLSDTDLLSSKTSLEVAKADWQSAQSGYDQAKLNLEQYAKILSPLNGIVLERNIDEGQTVVANSGSVTQLFTLAENLENLEIYAQVDEIDIGKIQDGQDVRFTVEAFPEQEFTGKVRQIRKMPTTSNNVVYYTVVIDSKNPNTILLPGMTANVEFLVTRKENILLVPNAAFKFTPPEQLTNAAAKQESSRTSSGVMGGMPLGGPPGGPGLGMNRSRTNTETGNGGKVSIEKQIWLKKEDGSLEMRNVRIGITDGKYTEVINGAGLEGANVIVKMR